MAREVDSVDLVLPWPPSANRYWRVSAQRGTVRTHLSQKALDYRERVGEVLMTERWPSFKGARVRVHITTQAPTRRKYDIDNRLKPLLDALEHNHVFNDDEQVDDLRVVRGGLTTGGAVRVRIERME